MKKLSKSQGSVVNKAVAARQGPSQLQGRQLLDQNDDYDQDGIGAFDTQQQITIEDDDEEDTVDIEMQDIMDENKYQKGKLQKNGDTETATDVESKGKKSKRTKTSTVVAHKHRESDVVEQCTKAYEENKRPRKLGKMFAFWYNGKNEPRIVVGPDFGFSLLELTLSNGILGLILNSART